MVTTRFCKNSFLQDDTSKMMSDVSDNDQGSDMIDEEDDSDAVSHWEVPANSFRLSRQACARRDSNPFRFSFCIFLHCSG